MANERGNPKNLRPYRKGESGNPAGRKKGSRNTSAIIREILDTEISLPHPLESYGSKNEVRLTIQEAMVYNLVQKALDGNLQAYDRLIDRVEGKPAQANTPYSGTTSHATASGAKEKLKARLLGYSSSGNSKEQN